MPGPTTSPKAPPKRPSAPSAGPIQGLAASRPQAGPPPVGGGGGDGADPQQLVQVAATVLSELSDRFGPQIIEVFKQLLAGPPPGAGAQGPPVVGGGVGQMPPGRMGGM